MATNAAGNRIVIGALAHGHGGVQSGAVWVISDPGTPAQREAELLPSSAIPNMLFSQSIAMSAAGDVVIVGAPGTGPTLAYPRVFVFHRGVAGWVEEWCKNGVPNDSFGFAVGVNGAGDRFAVGAPMRCVAPDDQRGVVEVYRHQPGGWVLEAAVRPQDSWYSDRFGNYLAMAPSGDMLAARSFAHGSPQPNGAVYLFRRTGNTWAQVAKLQEPVAYSLGGFGTALALSESGDTVAIGNYADNRLAYMQGAVSVFKKGSGGWAFHSVLLPSSATSNCNFGFSVALNAAGDRLLAGAPVYPYAAGYAGAVEEWGLGTNGWQRIAVHRSPTPEYAAKFGYAVCASSSASHWLAGEPQADYNGTDSGVVRLFEAPCVTPSVYCTAQANSLGCVPQISAQGTPSCSAPSGFTIAAMNVLNQQSGLLFYGTIGPTAAPWKGGTLCVQPPLRRLPLAYSGGSPLPVRDCSGTFSRDFTAWTWSGVDPALFPGQHVRAQYLSRDPAAPFRVNLTDAVEFYLEP